MVDLLEGFETSDLELLARAERIEIKKFKKHDKVKLLFSKGDTMAWVKWVLKCHVEELSEPKVRELILSKGVVV